MAHRQTVEHFQQKSSGPGFIGYLVIAMWFLLTVLASSTARAQESVILTAADILPDIEAALAANGLPAGAEIILNDPAQAFALGSDISFAHVSYNAKSGRFVMRLENSPVAIAGVARVSEMFAVLARSVERGEIIHEADIAYLESADVRAGAHLQDAEDLIGMEARRPLRAQAPIRASDVAAPMLIKKGAVVTVTYAIEGLRLTHQGVAMASGAQGEVISVRNIQSDRVLKGVVDSENLVRVAAPRAALQQQES